MKIFDGLHNGPAGFESEFMFYISFFLISSETCAR